MSKIKVLGWLPSNAHLSLESNEIEYEIITRHVNSQRGRQNALYRARELNKKYSMTHGNAAARSIKIEMDDISYTIQEFLEKSCELEMIE